MWERACSRMRCVIQHIQRLLPCIREQARSHIFDSVTHSGLAASSLSDVRLARTCAARRRCIRRLDG
ncbi:hypothetical protein FIV38_07360 [Pseudomonas proteolytica]|nr:hypothetical protein F4W61_25860 [Pseudomonas proteolytica]TWR84499.1 hypothetical protein FIV38_07360 [Pseudomonas proteolytica]